MHPYVYLCVVCLCLMIEAEVDDEGEYTVIINGLRKPRRWYLVLSRVDGKLSAERKIVCMYIRFLIRVRTTFIIIIIIHVYIHVHHLLWFII